MVRRKNTFTILDESSSTQKLPSSNPNSAEYQASSYSSSSSGGGGVTDHEALTGLQGGSAFDHKHLTTAQLAIVDQLPTSLTANKYLQVNSGATAYELTSDLTHVGTLRHNTSYTILGTEPTGSSYWDSDNNTFSDVLGNGVIGQRYKELFIDGQNDTGVTINNGTPVAYLGSIGASGNFRIKKAQASASEPAFYTIGILTETLNDGESGKITTTGKVRGIQTDGANYGESWSAGDIVYISGTTAGYLTKTPPNAPIPAIPVALVISAHATNGTLEVRPSFPESLTMLSDVNGTALTTDGQILVWDNTNQYFDFTANINDYALPSGTEGQILVYDTVNGWEASSMYNFDDVGRIEIYNTAYNVLIGDNANINGTGLYNINVGYQTMGRFSNAGKNNVNMGFRAGWSNQGIGGLLGHNNVNIGYIAGYVATYGYNNVNVGSTTGSGLTTGYNNTFLGYAAGLAQTNIINSVAIGAYSLASNTVGGGLNLALGAYALNSLTSGSNNTAIGGEAGRYGASQNNVLLIGYRAGLNNDGDYNISIGYLAQGLGSTTGGDNLSLGNYAGYNLTSGADNILLGNYAGYSLTTESDKLYISNSQTNNLIVGDFSTEDLSLYAATKIGTEIDSGNYSEFEDDGSLIFHGDATMWDDMAITALSFKVTGSKQPTFTKYTDDGAGSTGVYTYSFSPSQEQELYFSTEIPHGWELESNLDLHIHWAPDGTNTGDVKWVVELSWVDIGSTPGNSSLYSGIDAADGTAKKHQYFDLADVTGTGHTLSGMIIGRVYRDATDATDTYTGEAYLLSVDFHYKIDAVGSREEATK